MTRYAFVRLVIFLIAGILLHEQTDAFYTIFLYSFIALGLIYGLLYLLASTFLKHLRFNIWHAMVGYGVVFCFGYLITYHKTSVHTTSNLMNDTANVLFYKAVISNEVREREKFLQTEAEVSEVKSHTGWHHVSGKVMLNIRRSDSLQLTYGDVILVKGSPQIIPEPLNPQQFNYKKYLSHQQIYHQHFIQANQLLVLFNKPSNWFLEKSIAIRRYFDKRLKELVPTEQEYAIATGIILGVKDALDNDLKQAYSSAGAMHILAVSGMHVALLFEVLVLLLGGLKKLKFGNLIFAIVVLAILWFYSFITGLSPSVLRAIVMFSFIILAQTFRRSTNIYNTLAVSAFVLLCYNPYLIMDVGFQLSYLAVIGIVYFYNPVYRLFAFQNIILNGAWQITCVSIAAQILTFPVSLYHFHQFPVYFLFANLVLIPVSTVVLYLGLATLTVSFIPYLSIVAGLALKWSIWILNQCVFITENLPGALLTGIDINEWETILLYAAILCVCLLFEFRRFYWFVLATTCVAIVSLSSIYESIVQKKQKELAVFSISKHSVLNIIDGQKNIFITDSSLLANEPSWGFNLKAYWYKKGINYKKGISGEFKDLDKYYSNYRDYFGKYGILLWQKKKILLLRQKTFKVEEVIAAVKPDYIIVQNNAIRSIQGLNSQFKLVLDASNSLYNTQKLQKQAKEKNIMIWSVNTDGAFLLQE
jgi:competence protein ComEC